jgi:carboxymethylenebutenolidase
VGASIALKKEEKSLAPREEALHAGNVFITGHGGDRINAYQAVSREDGPPPGVWVIHHLLRWDSPTKEITRRVAATGYNAICPNLYAKRED